MQTDSLYKDQNGLVRTVKRIDHEMMQLICERDRKQEQLIHQAEKLNADPTLLPGDFLSSQQLLERYGQRYKRRKFGDMWMREEMYPGNYVTPGILRRLTRLWMRKNCVVLQQDATYYYNNRFRDSVLEYQRPAIRNGDFKAVSFMVDAYDRPLVYQYNPVQACFNPMALAKLLDEWNQYDKDINAELDQLSNEQEKADRGNFMVSPESPMGSLYQEGEHVIFEIPSKRFWSYVDCLYELSEQHPEYFGQGASRIMEGMYEHHLVTLYGKGRSLSLEDFKLRANQEYLFFSDEEKQFRLDLYRQIDPSNGVSDEVFTGGLFHIFDHFKGLRASEMNRGDFDLQEQQVFTILKDLLFNRSLLKTVKPSGDQVFHADYKYEIPLFLDEKLGWIQKEKSWKGIFYFNQTQNLFYLTSLHIR